MRVGTGAGLLAACGLLWSLGPGSAAAQADRPEGVEVPLLLILNGEPRGDVFARLAADGDVLLPLAALADRGVVRPGGATVMLDGESFVSLRSIDGARHELDERTLVLSLTLPPGAFGLQARSVGPPARGRGERTEDSSAFLNYRLGHGVEDGRELSTLATEAAARAGAFLLRSESLHLHRGSGTQSVRFQTQVVHDDRDTARRWIAGDSFASSGDLGSTLNLGGLTFAKAYQITPYFVRQPTVTFAGAATLPSDVEVFVGDARVYQGRVAPGAFELRDFSYYGGRQDVRILVRDALGQEQVFAYPFYFTDLALAAGLHEYSYSAGWLREGYGVESGQYGPFAASAIHRYGASDAVTVGLRGEYSDDRGNLGPVAALRLDWGTLSLAASASHGDGQDGLAAAAGYLYREGSFSVRAGHRELSAAYAVADPFAGPRLLRHESLAGVGYGTAAAGNIDLQYLHSVFRDRSGTRAVALNYSRTLLRRVGLFAVLRRVLGDAADTEAFVGLSASLGPYRSLSAYSASAGQGHTEVVQAGDTLGPREGFGYRVSAERDTQNGVETRRFLPYVEYGGRNGTLIAEARTVRSGGESFDYAAVAVQGALAAVTGGAGLTRRIDDSFAQVRIEPPAAGVRVYHNGQDVGRTDEAGRLLVPALASFIDNPVAIEDRDLPLEYNVRRTVRTLSPPFRGGAVARFDAKVAAGVSGRLYRRTAAGLEPLEYHEAHLWIAGKHVAFPTGSGGEFYFEDLARGVYDGRARIGDQTCAFRLAVPEPAGPVTEIDPPVVCDALP